MAESEKIPTHEMKSNGYTFIYTPSMHCMDVKSPNGGLEIIHNLQDENWVEVANEILAQNKCEGDTQQNGSTKGTKNDE